MILELAGIGAGPVVGTTYTLITPFGSTTNVDATDFTLGDHAGLTLLVAGFDVDGTADGIYFNSGTRTVSVQFTAVPEPTSLAIMSLAAGGMLARRRRFSRVTRAI